MMWFFYACVVFPNFLPGQPRSDISQNLCPATQCTHAAACSMRTTFLYILDNPATQCMHAAACSMRTLSSLAKILRNITSKLACRKFGKTRHAAPGACVEKTHHCRSQLYICTPLFYPQWVHQMQQGLSNFVFANFSLDNPVIKHINKQNSF